MRKDILRLVCQENSSLKQVACSETIRRLFKNTYPSEKAPPTSPSTLTQYLSDDASRIRSELHERFEELRRKGGSLYSVSTPTSSLLDDTES